MNLFLIRKWENLVINALFLIGFDYMHDEYANKVVERISKLRELEEKK